jgi:hypothetical protein
MVSLAPQEQAALGLTGVDTSALAAQLASRLTVTTEGLALQPSYSSSLPHPFQPRRQRFPVRRH